MARVVTYGRQPDTAPPGMRYEVHYPELAKLDQGTSEGWISRVLESDGADTRGLPRTIFHQDRNAGHDGAMSVGALYEVTADGETGILSGKGWLADNEDGRKAAFAVYSKMLQHNSIDIAEVDEIEIVDHGDFWDDDYVMEVRFKKWSLGATTHVGMPAFADAHAAMASDEEITAALDTLGDAPLINDAPTHFSAHTSLEIVAGMEGRPKWDYFHRTEADIPHKIMVGEPDEFGWIPVFGHLARWGQPHTGIEGRSVFCERSRNNYATFCQPSVLTDRGLVNCGPITLYGGHVSLKDACDDPKNAWADVKVIDGKHGPWVCGVVRPHVAQSDAEVYVARASRISGHWKGGDLRMIVSVNAEGFPIEAHAEEYDLVASFTPEPSPIPAALKRFTEMNDEEQAMVKQWIRDAQQHQYSPWRRPITSPILTVTHPNSASVSIQTNLPNQPTPEQEQDLAEERMRLLAEDGLTELLGDD